MKTRLYLIVISRLYSKYCRQHNPAALQSWLQQEDDWNSLARQSVIESYSSTRIESRLSALVSFIFIITRLLESRALYALLYLFLL